MTAIAKLGSEFLVNTQTASNQYVPTVTGLVNGGFVVTWSDQSGTLGDSGSSIKAQLFNAGGAKVGSEFLVNTVTTGSQFFSTITGLANGGFVVMWNDDSHAFGDNYYRGVAAQVFDASGAKIGSEFQVNTWTDGDQIAANVTGLSNGGFVVTWQDGNLDSFIGGSHTLGDSSGTSIKAQLFNASGAKVGSEFLVNTQTAGDQLVPRVTGLANGSFVVTWYDWSGTLGDSSYNSVKAQVFDAGGMKVGSEFLVNTLTSGEQFRATITTLANGNFVVTWQDGSGAIGDNGNYGIAAQVFNASGTKVGTEFLVNTQTAGYQEFPTITALANGDFVVTWQDGSGTLGDSSGTSIKAQLFDAGGAKLGSEVLVNTQTANDQLAPTITGLANGGFVITWQDFSGTLGDSSAYSVKAQVFILGEAPVGVNDNGAATEKGGVNNGSGGSNATGNVLTNDTDADNANATLVVSAIRTGGTEGSGTAGTLGSGLVGAHGTLTLNANGSYTYVINESDAAVQALNAGGTLTDSFNYTVNDPINLTDMAVLTITINGANDAPVGVNDTGSATAKGGSNATGNVLTNDTDVDNTNASLVVSAIRTGGTEGSGTAGTLGSGLTGAHGTLTLNANGSYSYVINSNDAAVNALAFGGTLTDSFNYTVKDPSNLTDTAVLTVTINGANLAPVAVNDAVTAARGGSNATGNVLTNDTDVDNTNASLVVSAIRTGGTEGSGTAGTLGSGLTGAHGTLTLNANGSYSYVINSNDAAVNALAFGGTLTDSFNYAVKDPSNATDIGVLTVTVAAAIGVQIDNQTTHGPTTFGATPYSGPVAGLQYQYIDLSTDNLNVTAVLPNGFIHTGSGFDAIDVSNVSGTNVLDGGTNSNFLVGGTAAGSFDTFFVDNRSPPGDIWSTVVNFHKGDDATVWGVTQAGFNLAFANGEGAPGFTGLTLHVTKAGVPTASLTLAGYTTADLTNGKLSTSFGTVGGSDYFFVHGN